MRNLLTASAVLEAGAGVGIVASPSLLSSGLFGAPLDAAAGQLMARLAGVELIALAIACWLARHDGQSRAGRGLVGGMLFLNAGAAVLLVYAAAIGSTGPATWPAVLFHLGMGVWCLTCLVTTSRPVFERVPGAEKPLSARHPGGRD